MAVLTHGKIVVVVVQGGRVKQGDLQSRYFEHEQKTNEVKNSKIRKIDESWRIGESCICTTRVYTRIKLRVQTLSNKCTNLYRD